MNHLRLVGLSHEVWTEKGTLQYTPVPAGIWDLDLTLNELKLLGALWTVLSFKDRTNQPSKRPSGIETIREIEMDNYRLDDLKWTCTYGSGLHLAEERFKGDFFKQKNDPKGSKFSKAKKGLIKKGLLRIEVDKQSRCEFWVLDISTYPQHKLTSVKEREEKEERALQQEKEKEQRRQARMADHDSYARRCEAIGSNAAPYDYWIRNRPNLESALKEAEQEAAKKAKDAFEDAFVSSADLEEVSF